MHTVDGLARDVLPDAGLGNGPAAPHPFERRVLLYGGTMEALLEVCDDREQADMAKALYEEILEDIGLPARVDIRPRRLPSRGRPFRWIFDLVLIVDLSAGLPDGLEGKLIVLSRRLRGPR